MKHLLLQNSFVYKKRKEIEPPIGFTYDKNLGAWVNNDILLVSIPDYAKQATKKFDIETGEDHKGQ